MNLRAEIPLASGVGRVVLTTDRERPNLVRIEIPGVAPLEVNQADFSEAVQRVMQFPPFDGMQSQMMPFRVR